MTMDYNKYLKVLVAVGALVVAYGVGHHFGAVQRPALTRLPQPLAMQRLAQQRPIVVNCGCGKTAKHNKHASQPKVAKHKKHKAKAGKPKAEAPPTK